MRTIQRRGLVFRPFLSLVLLIALVSLGVWHSTTADTRFVAAENQDYIPDRYIVTLRNGVSPELFGSMVNTHSDATVIHTYSSAIRGFSGAFSDEVAGDLDDHPFVVSVEPDQTVSLTDQAYPTGITRIGADENATAAINSLGFFEHRNAPHSSRLTSPAFWSSRMARPNRASTCPYWTISRSNCPSAFRWSCGTRPAARFSGRF